MKIAYIVPGTGGAFYCENCIRDCSLISGLEKFGHEVYAIPIYLPLNLDEDITFHNDSIFFGAIKIYLKGHFPFIRLFPDRFLQFLDSPSIMKLAVSMASSTRASGHEQLTIAMLEGSRGILASEFERLCYWLTNKIQPDAVFLSNALLLGIGSSLKRTKNIPVFCILQDEHTWVESSRTSYQSLIWDAITENMDGADIYFTPSLWYKEKAESLMNIPSDRIRKIPFGVNPEAYAKLSPLDTNPFKIGYLSRQCYCMGFDILVDAYLQLMKDRKNGNCTLSFCGGYTKDDRALIKKYMSLLEESGLKDRITFYNNFNSSSRISFLSDMSLLSVPVRTSIALGTFLIEAMTAGVPVVQPKNGGFSEIIDETGGGVLYDPDSPESLAGTIEMLLKDNRKLKLLSKQGKKAVESKFNIYNMAGTVIETIDKG
jgi:glycosyltransferase involved in cell wall biosynthesis